jgi:protein-tyrosine-phosphatase
MESAAKSRSNSKMAKRTILFVCSGNTCRSPMAEALARALIADGLLGTADHWEVRSAGLWAGRSQGATSSAVRASADHGADLRAHRSQPMTKELVDWAGLIFGMTQEHVDAIVRDYPVARDRVWRLDETDIMDPFGRDQAQYDRTALQIRAALYRRLPEITGDE